MSYEEHCRNYVPKSDNKTEQDEIQDCRNETMNDNALYRSCFFCKNHQPKETTSEI